MIVNMNYGDLETDYFYAKPGKRNFFNQIDTGTEEKMIRFYVSTLLNLKRCLVVYVGHG